MAGYKTIEWRAGVVRMLDQRRLPHAVIYQEYQDYRALAQAITDMVIRGAPAIGVAAGYGLALAIVHSPADDLSQARQELATAAEVLCAARPTAVNLFYAVTRIMQQVESAPVQTIAELGALVLAEAQALEAEDVRINRGIGLHALPLVPQKATFIHHCNTGALATTDYGTALGIIRTAHEHGRVVFVYVDETRPRLQGARLTAWELQQLGIPHAVIVDGASGYIMKTRQVDLATVGCDRVAANGDTANKIGTYNLALAARAHGVPFYVAAPTTTIDLAIASGDAIEIEMRPQAEVTDIGGERIPPFGTQALNPAFDVTPAEFISAIITEEGVAYPPYEHSLAELAAKAAAKRVQT